MTPIILFFPPLHAANSFSKTEFSSSPASNRKTSVYFCSKQNRLGFILAKVGHYSALIALFSGNTNTIASAEYFFSPSVPCQAVSSV